MEEDKTTRRKGKQLEEEKSTRRKGKVSEGQKATASKRKNAEPEQEQEKDNKGKGVRGYRGHKCKQMETVIEDVSSTYKRLRKTSAEEEVAEV